MEAWPASSRIGLMDGILSYGVAGVLGLAAWPLLEYASHGVVFHRMRTFAGSVHWDHHRNPARVFISPLVSVPIVGLLWALLTPLLGLWLAAAFLAGLVSGFVRYEYVHWRIHFRPARTAREAALRSHHLAHHYVDPSAYFGVSVHWIDRAFGSLPERWREDYATAATLPPLSGRSNLGSLVPPRPEGLAPVGEPEAVGESPRPRP